MKNSIKTINEIVDENIRDIGDDTASEFAKMRIRQNLELLFAAKKLAEILDVYGYTE